jgi:heme-degrading monooxygenase HmoA
MSHVRIAVYSLINWTAREVGDRAQEGMLGIFRGQAGFKAYGLAETQEGTVVSVSLWESREQAEQANDLAASWVKENLTDRVQLESAQVGDFLFFENA